MNRLVLALSLLAVPACAPEYDHVNVELYSSPPVPVSISGTHIDLPVGLAIVVEIEPISRGRIEYVNSDEVVLDAEDREILRADPTEHPRRFVLVGVAPGETCVVVEVLGDREDCIPATVSE